MVLPINTALSGLAASSLRLNVAANNIANLQSTTTLRNGERVNEPYVPQQVVQTSDANGGVRTDVQDVTPASVQQYNPSDPAADANGLVQIPNIDLEKQMMDMIIGGYDFRANLKVFKAADEQMKNLLDIFG